MPNINEMIQALRKIGWSDAAIGEAVGLTRFEINKLRRGVHRNPNYESGKRIEGLYEKETEVRS